MIVTVDNGRAEAKVQALTAGGSNPLDILDALERSAAQQRINLACTDPAAQELAGELGVEGALREDDTEKILRADRDRDDHQFDPGLGQEWVHPGSSQRETRSSSAHDGARRAVSRPSRSEHHVDRSRCWRRDVAIGVGNEGGEHRAERADRPIEVVLRGRATPTSAGRWRHAAATRPSLRHARAARTLYRFHTPCALACARITVRAVHRSGVSRDLGRRQQNITPP